MLTPHPLRDTLHNEVHARPYESMTAPLTLTHMAWLTEQGQSLRPHLDQLLRSRHLAVPAEDASHLSIDIGGLCLRWERHTEFETCTFWRTFSPPAGSRLFDSPAVDLVPRDWLHSLPGQWLVGLHLVVVDPGARDGASLARESMLDSSLIGSRVMDAEASVYTDLRLQADGFSRVLVCTRGMSARRLGRAVQRLLDAETYRMMALLGLPVARRVSGALVDAERNLATIASEIRSAERQQEPQLLLRLTQLAGQVESLYASTHARFSASAAYFELVQRRIAELKEDRLPGLQTLQEFMDRRLTPAMQTCAWAARRQQALSERISRTSNLLRTRVEIEQQQSSQDLLDAMNRRQKAQLLLQSAVESLSVAAITYYGAGLVGYLAKGAKEAGANLSPEMAVAASIPVVAFTVWSGLRRLHDRIARDELV
jgi:uncharacterized membrane-anchored protein